MKVPFILPLLITRPVLLARSDRVHYVRYRSGDLKMLCWVYVVDGVRVGRCAASATTTWAPSSGLAMLEGCYKVMKSEDVIVKSEGTLHTSLIDD